MIPSTVMTALALALSLPLLLLRSALGAEQACHAAGGACQTAVDDDDPSALQLGAGQHGSLKTGNPDGNTTAEELEKILQEYANAPLFGYYTDYAANAPLATECHLDESSCPMTDFTPKSATKVFPGGNTQCIDGSPYYFEVSPNDPNKLHIHFQGGGACWDEHSYHAKITGCTHNAYPNPTTGIFDLENPQNPLKDYTLVVIQYCSGDMHGGNATNDYGEVVHQVGYYNADAVIKYALSQFPTLQNLVISGLSAGSLGVQFWSGKVIDLFSDRKADIAVIADSFMGVLWPPSELVPSEVDLINLYNMCNPAVLAPAQKSDCDKGEFTLQENFIDSMQSHHDVRFSAINSKSDAIQIAFEWAYMQNKMTVGQFYKGASLILQQYIKEDNFYNFLVKGEHHCYLPYDYLYTASPQGAKATSGTPLLIDWLSDFLTPSEQAERSVCYGPEKELNKDTPVGIFETDYCASGLVGVQ